MGPILSTSYSCSFEGYQDTLYAYSQRQFYRECDIYGTITFIFWQCRGSFPRLQHLSTTSIAWPVQCAITTKGRTDPQQTIGTSIHHCNIRPAEDLDGTETYLGRTRKEYSRTVLTCNLLWIA